uniref:carboxypeptidase-like regulatory domain-containing protein n=1 Tax=Pseudopedobacter sp. TaxID=1936787 RepID=UPI003342501C
MMTVKKYCLILCALLLLYTSAIAQKCDIVFYGTVKDGITGKELPGASISIVNTAKEAPANQQGHFHFNRLCSGDYRVD